MNGVADSKLKTQAELQLPKGNLHDIYTVTPTEVPTVDGAWK